jgi:para-nitrobenzyl esterase
MNPRLLAKNTVAAFALLLATSTACRADALDIKTEQGKIHGKTINSDKVRAYLGLPYAAPPVGDMRWKAPAPPAKWKTTRDVSTYGATCAQNHVFDDMIFQDTGSSEDCLFLNVYVPADATDKSKLPVMFWIHGGGFYGGGSDEPRHNGDFLPLKGVILVTINYRLGVFGFLATSDLAKEQNGTAGNYALMDMVAALHWVHANIKNFGGDANNVTIFGESAGSSAVSMLMATPTAKGLFAKAIGESGSVFSDRPQQTLAAGEEKGDIWAATTGAKSLADLRALSTDKILSAAKTAAERSFAPVTDGKVFPEPPTAIYAAGKQAHVPLLAGWNRDEGYSVGEGMTVAKYQKLASDKFPNRSAEFLKLYPGTSDEEATRSAIDYGSDAFIAASTWRWIEAHKATGGSPIYRYHFELAATPSKYHAGTFAFHSDDIEYVFGTLDTRPGFNVRPEDRKLSDLMMSYWTNFAKTGDPNGPGLPQWPAYNKDESVLHLDTTVTAAPDTLRPRYEFLGQK